ncbi:MAG: 2-phosphosulfolactate phosphatase [Chloroflexi bacterium]|nr:2-phosphosulfolactate phosphatase [Chloroflexota bacterium]
MQFKCIHLGHCDSADGVVVVIDVLRAFTTAAFALAGGAEKIILVSTVEEAFALREQMPGALIMGEVGGLPPDGFDFGNSPDQLSRADVNGRTLIQRTTAGTQGVVGCAHASPIFVGSFVCAQATTNAIRALDPALVTFVITGWRNTGGYGDEDAALADYIEALLLNKEPESAYYLQRVRQSRNGRKLSSPERELHFNRDVDLAVQLDQFDFAMQVKQKNNQLVLTKQQR